MRTYTTIEQSKKLIELGLEAKTSDMHYWYAEGKEYAYIGQCSDPNGIPCWSAGALLNILPLGSYICHGGVSMDNGREFDIWFSQYENPIDLADIDSHIDITIEDDEMFGAIFKMVCWMLENGIILKKQEN